MQKKEEVDLWEEGSMAEGMGVQPELQACHKVDKDGGWGLESGL